MMNFKDVFILFTDFRSAGWFTTLERNFRQARVCLFVCCCFWRGGGGGGGRRGRALYELWFVGFALHHFKKWVK